MFICFYLRIKFIMQRICVLALIGLPAAGKTTFSHWLLNLSNNYFNTIHLCYDNILNFHNPHPNSNKTTIEIISHQVEYKKQRLEISNSLEELIKYLKTTISDIPKDLQTKLKIIDIESVKPTADILILIDDNNFYSSMRYKLFKICRENSLAYAQIYFECDMEQSLRRNRLRPENTKVPERIIKEMAHKIEKPNLLKNFWEDQTLFITERIEGNYDVALPFIKNAFENVVKSLEINYNSAKESVIPNVGHQLDLLLRRRIKQLLNSKELDNVQKKLTARQLNEKRKYILEKLRAQHYKDDEEVNLQKYVDLMN